MKVRRTLLTLILFGATLPLRSATKITPAFLRAQVATIHKLNHASINKLGMLIDKLPAKHKNDLISFAQQRLTKVQAHPLKGNILIGDGPQVTQENLTQLLGLLA
ncbi:MAG: hypothetical protein PVJ92_01495 [Candidatus Dependentiae bacterium]|jgi:hypothetical protein